MNTEQRETLKTDSNFFFSGELKKKHLFFGLKEKENQTLGS